MENTIERWTDFVEPDQSNIRIDDRLKLYRLINLTSDSIRQFIAVGLFDTEFCHFRMTRYLIFVVMLVIGSMRRSPEGRNIIRNLLQQQARLFDSIDSDLEMEDE